MSNKECAFCPNTADFSGEHIWSDWFNKVLPFKKGIRFTIRNDKREIVRMWTAPELNWETNVVCGKCNSGWMSELENNHAKPAMVNLILDKRGTRVGLSRARSIALFAFKTAVIFDHLARKRPHFFERSARHEFRKSLTIPLNVAMWLTRYGPSARGEANTAYHEGRPTPERSIEIYVCTYSVQSFVLQVVSYKTVGVGAFSPENEFPAIPFWPKLIPENGIVWPPIVSLNSLGEFNAFSDRWQKGTATY
jgi:hypothetical protein